MTKLARIAFYLLVIFLYPFSSAIFAENTITTERNHLNAAQRELVIDENANQVARQQLTNQENHRDQWYQYYKVHLVTPEVINHIQLDQIAAKAAIDSLKIAIAASQEIINDVQSNIASLHRENQHMVLFYHESSKNQKKANELEETLDVYKSLDQVERQRVKILQDGLKLAEERLDSLSDWYFKMLHLYQKQTQKEELAEAATQMNLLQTNLHEWISKLSSLNDEMEKLVIETEPRVNVILQVQLKIIEASEHIEMTRNEIWLLHQQNSIQSLRMPVNKTMAMSNLNSLDKRSQKALIQLRKSKKYVQGKIEYLQSKEKEYKKLLVDGEASSSMALLAGLVADYQNQLSEIEQLTLQTSEFQKDIKVKLKEQLTVRQELPALDLEEWLAIGSGLFAIPGMTLDLTESTYHQLINGLNYLSLPIISAIIFGIVVISLLIWALFSQGMSWIIALEEKRERFTTNLLYFAIQIIQRNLLAVLLVSILSVLQSLTEVQVSLYINLLFVFLFFKLLIDISRLTLIEPLTTIDKSDVRLYGQLKWSFIIGGLVSAIVVLTHHLPVTYEVKALSNRVSMVLVLLAGIMMLKRRKVLPDFFLSKLPVRRYYIHHVLRLLSLLIPVALISNAVIGLLGYVELAWQVGIYQAYFLVIMTLYLTIRGLLIDAMDYTSEYVIRNISSGWVWAEAVMKPMDRILRIALFVLVILTFINIYELDHNPVFMGWVHYYPSAMLFELGNNKFSLLTLLEIFVVGSVLFWISRWSREFSFRWLYSKSRDIGLRNSLAVFTQYIFVVLGVVISLQILGINLTGFAVIAAAFAAGIGFGLRDVASNFFSGVMLLIERPYRTGDIVTLGEFEGRVVSTGVRSMTIRTWDYMDVIIPNADMFTKPFVNWTLQDSIVRTIIKLKIHRLDNPHFVTQLIFDILRKNPAIVDKPAAEILMTEISDSLIEMEVRYHMVVTLTVGRVNVKSDVLFAIWEAFKEHNIRAPIQQYDLSINQLTTPAEQ